MPPPQPDSAAPGPATGGGRRRGGGEQRFAPSAAGPRQAGPAPAGSSRPASPLPAGRPPSPGPARRRRLAALTGDAAALPMAPGGPRKREGRATLGTMILSGPVPSRCEMSARVAAAPDPAVAVHPSGRQGAPPPRALPQPTQARGGEEGGGTGEARELLAPAPPRPSSPLPAVTCPGVSAPQPSPAPAAVAPHATFRGAQSR